MALVKCFLSSPSSRFLPKQEIVCSWSFIREMLSFSNTHLTKNVCAGSKTWVSMNFDAENHCFVTIVYVYTALFTFCLYHCVYGLKSWNHSQTYCLCAHNLTLTFLKKQTFEQKRNFGQHLFKDLHWKVCTRFTGTAVWIGWTV